MPSNDRLRQRGSKTQRARAYLEEAFELSRVVNWRQRRPEVLKALLERLNVSQLPLSYMLEEAERLYLMTEAADVDSRHRIFFGSVMQSLLARIHFGDYQEDDGGGSYDVSRVREYVALFKRFLDETELSLHDCDQEIASFYADCVGNQTSFAAPEMADALVEALSGPAKKRVLATRLRRFMESDDLTGARSEQLLQGRVLELKRFKEFILGTEASDGEMEPFAPEEAEAILEKGVAGLLKRSDDVRRYHRGISSPIRLSSLRSCFAAVAEVAGVDLPERFTPERVLAFHEANAAAGHLVELQAIADAFGTPPSEAQWRLATRVAHARCLHLLLGQEYSRTPIKAANEAIRDLRELGDVLSSEEALEALEQFVDPTTCFSPEGVARLRLLSEVFSEWGIPVERVRDPVRTALRRAIMDECHEIDAFQEAAQLVAADPFLAAISREASPEEVLPVIERELARAPFRFYERPEDAAKLLAFLRTFLASDRLPDEMRASLRQFVVDLLPAYAEVPGFPLLEVEVFFAQAFPAGGGVLMQNEKAVNVWTSTGLRYFGPAFDLRSARFFFGATAAVTESFVFSAYGKDIRTENHRLVDAHQQALAWQDRVHPRRAALVRDLGGIAIEREDALPRESASDPIFGAAEKANWKRLLERIDQWRGDPEARTIAQNVLVMLEIGSGWLLLEQDDREARLEAIRAVLDAGIFSKEEADALAEDIYVAFLAIGETYSDEPEYRIPGYPYRFTAEIDERLTVLALRKAQLSAAHDWRSAYCDNDLFSATCRPLMSAQAISLRRWLASSPEPEQDIKTVLQALLARPNLLVRYLFAVRALPPREGIDHLAALQRIALDRAAQEAHEHFEHVSLEDDSAISLDGVSSPDARKRILAVKTLFDAAAGRVPSLTDPSGKEAIALTRFIHDALYQSRFDLSFALEVKALIGEDAYVQLVERYLEAFSEAKELFVYPHELTDHLKHAEEVIATIPPARQEASVLRWVTRAYLKQPSVVEEFWTWTGKYVDARILEAMIAERAITVPPREFSEAKRERLWKLVETHLPVSKQLDLARYWADAGDQMAFFKYWPILAKESTVEQLLALLEERSKSSDHLVNGSGFRFLASGYATIVGTPDDKGKGRAAFQLLAKRWPLFGMIPDLLSVQGPARRAEYCPYQVDLPQLLRALWLTDRSDEASIRGFVRYVKRFGLTNAPVLARTVVAFHRQPIHLLRDPKALRDAHPADAEAVEKFYALFPELDPTAIDPEVAIERLLQASRQIETAVLTDASLPPHFATSALAIDILNSLAPSVGSYGSNANRPALVQHSQQASLKPPAWLVADTRVPVLLHGQAGQDVSDAARMDKIASLRAEIEKKYENQAMQSFLRNWEEGMEALTLERTGSDAVYWLTSLKGRLAMEEAALEARLASVTNAHAQAAVRSRLAALAQRVATVDAVIAACVEGVSGPLALPHLTHEVGRLDAELARLQDLQRSLKESQANADERRKVGSVLSQLKSRRDLLKQYLQDPSLEAAGPQRVLALLTGIFVQPSGGLAKDELLGAAGPLLRGVFLAHMRERSPGHVDALSVALETVATASVRKERVDQWNTLYKEEYLAHFADPEQGATLVSPVFRPIMYALWGADARASKGLTTHPLGSVMEAIGAANAAIDRVMAGQTEYGEMAIYPVMGLGRALAGSVSNACYNKHEMELARGGYPRLYGCLLRVPGRKEIGGAFLLIDATVERTGKRALVIRALNPTEAALKRSIDARSTVEGVIRYAIACAERSDPAFPVQEVRMCMSACGRHSTNRVEIHAAQNALLSKHGWPPGSALIPTEETGFNDYSPHYAGETVVVWTRPDDSAVRA